MSGCHVLVIFAPRVIQPFLVHKIYQLDFSRKTDEFRMLERFLPHVRCALLAKEPHTHFVLGSSGEGDEYKGKGRSS